MNSEITNQPEVQKQKGFARIILVVLWLIVPLGILLLQTKFEIFKSAGMNFFYVLLALTLAIEVFVFKYYLSSEKKKDLPWIVLFVLLIQSLTVLALTFQDPDSFWRFLGFFLFLIFFALPEIILAILCSVAYFIFKKKNRTEAVIKKLPWVAVGIIVIGVFILPALNYSQRQRLLSQDKYTSGVTDYDLSDVGFRHNTKVNTILGKYKRPLRIFREGNTFFGISTDGERTPLSFLDSLQPDPKKEMYFDVFNDRVYYVKDEKLSFFDVAHNTSTLLPEPIQKALQETAQCISFPPCNKRQLTGVHNNTIALQTESMAGTGDVAVFNIQTGERVAQTVYAGYDTSRVYLLWIDGKGYRLILDAKGDPYNHPVMKEDGVYTRSEQTTANTMRIYLENHDEAYYMPSDDEFMDRWGQIVFSGGPSIYFKNRTPIFTFETNYQKARIDDASKFSVRNLYRLEDKKLGLEIEDKLVIIDPETKKVHTTSKPEEIENLLAKAVLLSGDGDQYNNQGRCAYTNEIYNLVKNNTVDFIFCLL